ncbi:ABC transporter permease [Candidatus Caldatribacterium sp.]|uniref:ABC transporter permease n=1 Tax=Candidatus Caldatribacterium sp. TaxID=2282143 RepID=UPI002997B730|nr:ABC transporter permease [Candidatus Caldatribacterium sp.]MDW8080810.1 ABC transporter permease [Candidatus Calescibacterium sp.]
MEAVQKRSTSLAVVVKSLFLHPETSGLVILLSLVGITAFLQKNFFEAKSIVRTINSFAPLVLLAMGQAVVIISGGIDLSAGAALSLFTCILTAVMRQNDPITGIYALFLTFLAALGTGVVNGLGIGYLRIPPVIVTFATSYAWLGIALFLRPTPGGESVAWFRVFYNMRVVEGIPEALRILGTYVPPALLLIVGACLLWYIVSRTRIGRYIYAVGSNIESAYVSGINTGRIQMLACLINAMFIFLAALFFVGQNQTGDARMGGPLTLRSIAAVVVGGIALTGGRGSVYMAIVGALILNFVGRIIFFANIPNAYQTLVSGIIVIAAIAGPAYATLKRELR